MAEIIVSHITLAEHPPTTGVLEGVTSASYRALTKVGVMADGELTPNADVIGIAGSLGFRDLEDANTFMNNIKQDLKVTGRVRGQATSTTLTFVNCKALGFAGDVNIGGAPDPEAVAVVNWQADSLTGPTTPA